MPIPAIFSNRLYMFTKKRRERYKLRKQKRLKNCTPTIICNNCVSGAIYRDLGLQYLSPTVNALIEAEDFIRFVKDLPHYLTCPMEETTLEGAAYPVGVLRKGDEQVLLRFLHDETFEKAKEKWIRRCGRVQWDNLYIILQTTYSKQRIRLRKTHKTYKAFKSIPYPNKRFLLNAWLSFDKEIVPLWKSFFYKKDSALEYTTKYSKGRLMDQFDYVSFLNKK